MIPFTNVVCAKSRVEDAINGNLIGDWQSVDLPGARRHRVSLDVIEGQGAGTIFIEVRNDPRETPYMVVCSMDSSSQTNITDAWNWYRVSVNGASGLRMRVTVDDADAGRTRFDF